MSENSAEKRGRGRPRSAPEGRGGTLTISINPHTRAALEAASAKLGRSLSQTAEYAIERGRIVGDLGAAAPAVADALQAMLRAASEIGDPTSSVVARDELRRTWVKIAEHAIPNVIEDAATAAATAAISAMRFAAIDAYSEVRTGAEGDERLERSLKHLQKMSTAQLFPGSSGWDEAEADFRAAAEVAGGAITDTLENLLTAAAAAARAYARAKRSKP